ncbi:MAG: three-Cys-motif partner protein TcmP [Lachnospiraceae bacterium]|nr:three-Cys-motif partner protein TcmP [Lachnospiraceae bacterium]
MSSSNNEIISKASPHTIKKFELIETYALAWAHKLLEYGRNTGNCNGIVYIDCMCNSGIYTDEETGELIEGSPIRVARVLSEIMREQNYQAQQAWLYFNDLSREKIDELSKHLPSDAHNLHIQLSVGDGNDLLKNLGDKLLSQGKINYLLVYDPYQATIDWPALLPFIRNWGEIILNHMVSDSIRAVSQVRRTSAITKYESTYLAKIEDLIDFGNDRDAFEQRIKDIITALNGGNHKRYYIASYPFFNSKNAVVYNLLHCTSNVAGFKLYKSIAWSTFGGKSSMKKTNIDPHQLAFDFSGSANELAMTTVTDENCYYVQDIVKFIISNFEGRKDVSLKEIWSVVDEHPVFPSDLYKNEIKDQLRQHGYKVHRSSIDFVM